VTRLAGSAHHAPPVAPQRVRGEIDLRRSYSSWRPDVVLSLPFGCHKGRQRRATRDTRQTRESPDCHWVKWAIRQFHATSDKRRLTFPFPAENPRGAVSSGNASTTCGADQIAVGCAVTLICTAPPLVREDDEDEHDVTGERRHGAFRPFARVARVRTLLVVTQPQNSGRSRLRRRRKPSVSIQHFVCLPATIEASPWPHWANHGAGTGAAPPTSSSPSAGGAL
jgi:hypothetical protein